MATLTPNYNLSKPDASDQFDAFRQSYNDNMDIIDNNLGGGGGGGGHTIIDENGSTMPTETALQFTGNVSVSDDNVNGRTVVNILGGGGGGSVNDVLVNGVSVVDGNGDAQIVSYKEVTQAVYDALPSSKESDGVAYFIKDGHGSNSAVKESVIASVEQTLIASKNYAIGEQFFYQGTLYTATAAITSGGIITINGNCTESVDITTQMFNRIKTLWTNPYPTSSFAAQNVLLSSSDYDLLLFVHRANNGSTAPCNSLVIPKGQNGNFVVCGTSASGVIANDRRITYTDDTHISYADNYYCLSHNAASVSNTRNIPYKIYGIKLT